MPRRGKKSKAARQREFIKGNHQLIDSQITENQQCGHGVSDIATTNDMTRSFNVVTGTLHQGNPRLQCPGIQCSFISLLSLVQMNVKEPQSWTAVDIDKCVIEGSEQFMRHCQMLKTPPKMLMAKELPESIITSEIEFECMQSDSEIKVGLLKPNEHENGECDVESISNALTNVFSKSKNCLMFCGGLTVAIAKLQNHFYTFDSHSRGKDGLLTPDGTSVLVECAQLDDLIAYIEILFMHSLNVQSSEPFEVVPVDISSKAMKDTGASNKNALNLDQTNESCKFRCNDSVETLTGNSEQQLTSLRKSNVNLEPQENAIKLYFEDQKLRENRFQESRSLENSRKSLDRRQYIKTYMKRKRQKEDFKREENKLAKLRMQQIRKTSDGKQINNERSAKGMRKLLQTRHAREKHNQMSAETMRKRLCVRENRQKHNEISANGMRKMRENEEKRERLKEKATECLRNSLRDDERKNKHRHQSVEAMKKHLKDNVNRQKHREKDRESKRKHLKDEHKLHIHRKRTAEGIRKYLNNELKKEKHNDRSAEGMRNVRKRKGYNANEYMLRKKT